MSQVQHRVGVGILYALAAAVLLGSASATAQTADADDAATIGKYERVAAALKEWQRSAARDRFDPQAIIEQVGRDPAKLTDWVSRNTTLLPYRGALRGARGVLMDRMGNSLDRSLLLADLLRLSGHNVRLARGEISQQQLEPALRRPPQAEQPAQAPSEAQVVEALAAKHNLDAAAAKRALEQIAQEKTKIERQATARIEQQSALLKQALADSALSAGQDASGGALEHWWVQRQEQGQWLDVDLCSDDPGKPLATLKQTLAVSGDPLRALADADCHQLTVRVLIEQTLPNGRKEHEVLKHTMRAPDLVGQRIALQHVPLVGPAIPAPGIQNPMAKLREAAAKHSEWLAVLVVGKQNISKLSFKDTGELNDDPKLDPAGKLGSGIRGAMGGFGGLGGGDEPAAPAGVLTAQWIEYQIAAPGQKPVTIRRPVFDLLGPAARVTRGVKFALSDEQRLSRGMMLLGEVEMLAQVCDLAPQFVEHASAEGLVRNTNLVKQVAASGAKPAEIAARLAGLEEPPGALYTLAISRRAWAPQRDALCVDRVNVLSLLLQPAFEDDDKLVLRQTMDIVHSALAARPDKAADLAKARLEQGVVDTVAEDYALGQSSGGIGMNAAAVFAAAGEKPQVLVVRKADEPAYKALELSADVRARIDQVLASGHLVVLPAQAVKIDGAARVAFYQVDPATAVAIGVTETGYHGAMTERSVINARLSQIFGYPKDWMGWIAKNGQQKTYEYLVRRYGHNPDLFRLVLQLENRIQNALLAGI